jgi:hypothetical protein
MKHLRRTTSGAAGNGRKPRIKDLRHTTSSAAGHGRAPYPCTCAVPRHNKRRRGLRPGTITMYLRGATAQRAAQRATAWAPRSSTCNAQRVPLRAAAWAPRSSTCDAQRAALRAMARRNDQVPAAHNERRRELRPSAVVKYLRHNERRRGLRPGSKIKYFRRTTSGAPGDCRVL